MIRFELFNWKLVSEKEEDENGIESRLVREKWRKKKDGLKSKLSWLPALLILEFK